MKLSSVTCSNFVTNYHFYKHFLCKSNKAIQLHWPFLTFLCITKLWKLLFVSFLTFICIIWLCRQKFQINFHFRGLKDSPLSKGCALIWGGRLLDILVSRVGASERALVGGVAYSKHYSTSVMKLELKIFEHSKDCTFHLELYLW